MRNPKTLAAVGASLALLALVIPRLPLFASGLGSGRMSMVGAHILCASALGRFTTALPGAASSRCAAVSAASAVGWVAFLSGLALLALTGYRVLAETGANRPAPPVA